ncbi:hypothetical protein IV203_017300 [Nitzschia inconspicua]|uniref:Uncharacterized protein n=1 Tax=Nitzschia inconspicua TaxID=303405 RepID=A0A9K3PIM9_9STRA|nr:hypothetical protein IV203_017300 [Nitzschia inconspicua]
MMMKSITLLLVVVATVLGWAYAQTRVESFPLSQNVPINCDQILETHRFDGTCCALNSTAGNGCVVNVVNGNCVIRGQYFTLDFTSTSSLPCPPSEYEVPGVAPPPTEAPLGDASVTANTVSHLLVAVFATMLAYVALT